MSHYDDEALRRWLDERLPSAAVVELEAHLSTCMACANKAERIANQDLPDVLVVPVRGHRPEIESVVLRELRAKTLFEDLLGFSTGGMVIFLAATLVPVAALLTFMSSESTNLRKDDNS